MNCPFCNTALAYDDGASRYTCPNGCVIQWSLEEVYEALATVAEQRAAENARLRGALEQIEIEEMSIVEARRLARAALAPHEVEE